MSWAAVAAAGVSLAGSYLTKDKAKGAKAPPPLDLDELARSMMVNTSSPYGGMTYTEGDNGQWTGEYEFSEDVQPIWDRGVDRAVNPDQAYQAPDELQQLKSVLMQSALAGPDRMQPPPGRERVQRERPQMYRPRSSYPAKYGPPDYKPEDYT